MVSSKARRQLRCFVVGACGEHWLSSCGILARLLVPLLSLITLPVAVLSQDSSGGVIPDDLVTKVLLIGVDGLVPLDTLPGWPAAYPNFRRLFEEGACTNDARTDPGNSRTLPMHTSMFTGMFVSEHLMVRNRYSPGEDDLLDGKLDDKNIFHLAKSRGLKGCMFAAKAKFSIFMDSWSGMTSWSASADTMYYHKRSSGDQIIEEWINRKDDCHLSFLHLKEPDRAGHDNGGHDNANYAAAVSDVDGYLGDIFDQVGSVADTDTAIVLTADHGMEDDDGRHSDTADPDNHVIPFCVWGPGVGDGAGKDLYELNPLARAVPIGNPPQSADPPPIRAHDAGPVCADFLGVSPPPPSRLDNDLSVTPSGGGGPGPVTSTTATTTATTSGAPTTTTATTTSATTSPATTATTPAATTSGAATTTTATTTSATTPPATTADPTVDTYKFFMLQERTDSNARVCIGVEDDGIDPRVDHFDNVVIELCDGDALHQMWSYVPDSTYDENDDTTSDAGLICNKMSPDLCLEVRLKRGNQAVRLNRSHNHQAAAVSGINLAWNYEGDGATYAEIRISDIRNNPQTCLKGRDGAVADKCSDLCLTYQGNSLDIGDNIMTQYITKRDCDMSEDEMWKWGTADQLGF